MWHRRFDSHFFAVYSSAVEPDQKCAILAAATQQWPFARMVRDNRHWPAHAQFSSRDFSSTHLADQVQRELAEQEGRRLIREMPEWSRKFPSTTFAVLQIHEDVDWCHGGIVCRDGKILRRRDFDRDTWPGRLISDVGNVTREDDPLLSRQFCNLSDLFCEWPSKGGRMFGLWTTSWRSSRACL